MPARTPVTTPEEEPTVDMVVLLLLHEPPRVASVSVVVNPTHTLGVPAIGLGAALTVIVLEELQPLPMEYEMTEVPAETPVIIPELEPTVAMPVLTLVHVPPPGVPVYVVVAPAHTVPEPEI